MNYRLLGRTGLKVSELCLGAMTFGSRFYNIGVVDQAGANAMVARAMEAGVNFFDTADAYSFGDSEQILGRALKECGARRDAVVVATKVFAPATPQVAAGGGQNDRGLSRQHVMRGCENSLRRLGTDYIDLYQLHGWDVATPMEEPLRALDDLVRQGKVVYAGCSNWPARHLARALCLSEERNQARFVSLQAYYSLACRDLEHELLPLCREEGLGVLPWSPLAGGFLTGKFRRGAQGPEGARRTTYAFPPVDERVFEAIEALDAVACARGATVAQTALAWLLAQPAVTSVIIGASRMEQLVENLKSSKLRLGAEEVARLSETTEPMKLYPQWMVERQNAGR